MSGIETLGLDLFSERSLQDPFDEYKCLRDAGPVSRLKQPDVYAIGRFHEVQAALRNSDTLINGEGIGFSNIWNPPPAPSVITLDGEPHRRMRGMIMKTLTPAQLRPMRDTLKRMIADRVAALKNTGRFDAMAQLATFLPIQAISHLVGLSEGGRERMLDWAAATFNTLGPDPSRSDLELTAEAGAYFATVTPETAREGSWVAGLFAAAEQGRLTFEEARAAISAYVIPSLDTTILAKGHLLYLLASNPEQWDLLCKQPELIGQAVLESVRHSSVLRWFSRAAVEDYAVGDQIVPKGSRVMLLYGCANRDERRYEQPDRFDIMRDARDQLSWGTGPHMCVGMHLARLEMEVMLEALVEAGAQLETGQPVLGQNKALYGFTELPFSIN